VNKLFAVAIVIRVYRKCIRIIDAEIIVKERTYHFAIVSHYWITDFKEKQYCFISVF